MVSLTRRWADAICERGAAVPTDAAAAIAKRSILDWIGCALSGAQSTAGRVAELHVARDGGRQAAQLVGSPARFPVGSAAWVNGIRGHVDDFDDSGSHPASYLTPTVLALGEEVNSTGNQVLAAWIAGYELATWLSTVLVPDRGWHTTPLYGTVGSAAAASLLLGLPADRTEIALGIAASSTAGLMGNFGTMTKAAHPGNAARSGIEAARLAADGFDANTGIIERLYGLVDCFGGSQTALSNAHEPTHSSWIIDRPPEIKAWPCCTGTHRALTAIETLLGERPLDPEKISLIEHETSRVPGTGPLQFAHPQTPLQAKFSWEYTIAAMIVDGAVNHETFTPERFGRGDVQELMARIVRRQTTESARHSHRTRGTVDVEHLRIICDGEQLDLFVGPRRTLVGSEVDDKFRLNAARGGCDRSTTEQIITHVAQIGAGECMKELACLLVGAAPGGGTRDEA